MSCFCNKKHVPDKGWCWVMLACSNVIMFLVFGVHYTYGTLYPHMLKEFNQGEGKTAWVGSLSSGLLFLSSFPAIKFYRKTSASTTCLIGSVLSGSGLIITSYIQDFKWLYLSYGCFFGVGTSFLYTPILIMIAKWFVKYRTVTTGLSAASGALGAIVLSPLIQYTIKHNGLRVTLKSAGICYLSLSVLCSLSFKPLKDSNCEENGNNHNIIMDNEDNNAKKKTSRLKQLFSNRSYLVFLFVMMITNFTYYIPIIHLVYYAEQLNTSPSHASLLISIWSISSIIGRLSYGKCMSYFPRHLIHCYTISMFLSGCVTTMTYFSRSYWLLVGYVVTYGFFDGSFIGLISLATLDIVGIDLLDQGFGVMLTCIGLPVAIGPPIIGFMNDKKLFSPQSMFLLAGLPFVIGSALMVLVVRWRAIDRKDIVNELDGNLIEGDDTQVDDYKEDCELVYMSAV